MRSHCCFCWIIAGVVLAGCSVHDGQDPVQTVSGTPPAIETPTLSASSVSSHRLWGLWEVSVAEDHHSAKVIPLRAADFHVNTVKFLESQPLSKCLTIDNFRVDFSGLLWADLTLWHPFPGNYNLTGFDVRGVFITSSNYVFPATGRRIAWPEGLPLIVYPDGYTPLFNPTEFPESPATSPLLTYAKGKYALGENLTSTLNPFIAFAQDEPRRVFAPGYHETRSIRMIPPDGAFSFGYAVSACWAPPGKEVEDPSSDFPPEANCSEPYSVEALIWPEIEPKVGSSSDLYVGIKDYQGLETIEKVVCECPDLFPDPVELSHFGSNEMVHVYRATISNELNAPSSYYPLLIRVDDTEVDPNFGPMSAWMVVSARVGEGWVRTILGKLSSSGSVSAADVAADQNGNSYLLARTWGCMDLDPGPGTLWSDLYTSTGKTQLLKLNARGELERVNTWCASSDEPSMQLTPTCAAAGALGDVYLAGYFRGEVDFDPGPGEALAESEGAHDAFLVGLDSSGGFSGVRTWGKLEGTTDYASCTVASIATDSSGCVLIAGSFHGIVDLDPGPEVLQFGSSDGSGHYVSKFGPGGELLWARSWNEESSIWHTHLALGPADEPLVLGDFQGTIDLDPGSGTDEYTSLGLNDVFLIKLNTEGEYQWGQVWGGTGKDYAYDLFCTAAGDLYTVGKFAYTVDFDPGPGEHFEEVTEARGAFLSKFDLSGQFQRVQTWSSEYLRGDLHVAAVDSGNVFVGGCFKKWADLGPGPVSWVIHTYGAEDVYISIFDCDCNFLKALHWGGDKDDSICGLASDGAGAFLTAGGFYGTVDFDPTLFAEEYTAIGAPNVYFLKLLPDGTL